MPAKLDLIQDEAVRFGLKHKRWGLLFEMGLGKTKTAIRWIERSGLRRIMVIGRFDDLATWEEELTQYSKLDFFNVCARKKRDWRAMALCLAAASDIPIILITYDAIKQLKPLVKEVEWDGVVADEVAELRHDSQRTRAVIECTEHIPNRVGMTGTMITNSPMNVFFQMKFIDGGETLGDNFYKFRARFFWPEPGGHRWHIFSDKLKTLHQLIRRKCVRARKAEVLDLPPKVYLRRVCSLTAEQQAAYERARDEFELELKSGEVLEMQYIIQQFTKLLQITGGFYYTDEGPVDLQSGKLDELRYMLDLAEFRQTKKIVIWAAFNHELARIRDLAIELGYHGVMLWKHTPDRKAARLQFRDDPNCQLFLGQVASGIGMNELKVADTVFYFSRSLKLIHRLQSEDRTHRKGSEIHRSIRYIDMLVPKTADEKVYRMLRKHKDVADAIIDGKILLDMLQ